jgi:hypothetical protein
MRLLPPFTRWGVSRSPKPDPAKWTVQLKGPLGCFVRDTPVGRTRKELPWPGPDGDLSLRTVVLAPGPCGPPQVEHHKKRTGVEADGREAQQAHPGKAITKTQASRYRRVHHRLLGRGGIRHSDSLIAHLHAVPRADRFPVLPSHSGNCANRSPSLPIVCPRSFRRALRHIRFIGLIF